MLIKKQQFSFNRKGTIGRPMKLPSWKNRNKIVLINTTLQCAIKR